MSAYADLHCHSRASDGTLPPAEVVALAARASIAVLALTDHDTLAGIAEARAAADRHGIRLVPGVEVSSVHRDRDLHVLGLFVDPESAPLLSFLSRFRGDRENRMREMVARARAQGIEVTMEDVLEEAQGGMPARPHLARILVRKRLVRDVTDAFDRFLGEGKPFYAPRPRPEPGVVADAIRAAGGLSFVAHPGVSRLDRIDLLNLKSAGLDGIEVWHSDHSSSDADKYERLAKLDSFLVTGGSDFHGAGHAGRDGIGRTGLSGEAFRRLEAAAANVKRA